MNPKLDKVSILRIITITISCVTNKNLTCFQNMITPPDPDISVCPAPNKVLAYDILYIRLVTPNRQFSTMFSPLLQTVQSFSDTEQSTGLIYYPVDSSGAILVTLAGEIHMAGKTIQNITADVGLVLQKHIFISAVSIKLINYYVSLIGEVNMSGRSPIYLDRLNIFQTIYLGRDLDDYSKRQLVQIILQTPRANVVLELSHNDRSILSSKLLYILTNIVIYTKPIKGVFFHMNSLKFGVIISTITMLTFIYREL